MGGRGEDGFLFFAEDDGSFLPSVTWWFGTQSLSPPERTHREKKTYPELLPYQSKERVSL